VLRVVIDTNIFVSALLSPGGTPAKVLQSWEEQRFLLLTSGEIIDEISETLIRFIQRPPYRVTPDDVNRIVVLLRKDSVEVHPRFDVTDAGIADPDDLIFLACALSGDAQIIVSGDHHLTSLGTWRGIRILTAREFLEVLNLEENQNG
jgi:uncharacterized protein